MLHNVGTFTISTLESTLVVFCVKLFTGEPNFAQVPRPKSLALLRYSES